ncbi:unnamed protein product [Caenorhabditis brenneri]
MPRLNSVEDAAVIFPSFKNPEFLYHLFCFLEEYTFTCVIVEFYIAIIGLCLTIFHVFILTRKSMMTSSVISVMIGIGICDSLSMIIAIIVKHVILNLYRDECTIPIGYLFYRIFWVLQYFRADVVRCSTWLGVLMAFTKYLALKFVARPSFKIVSNVSFGFYATFISFFISCLFSLFNFMRIEIVEYGTWTPSEKCGLDVTGTWTLYMMQPSHFYEFLNQYLLKTLIFLNALLTRNSACLAISTVMSTVSFFRTKMIENGIWIPDEKCGIKSDEIRYFYVLGPTEFETYLNGYLLRVFNFVNGFLSDILPCVLLPVATIILTVEVKNARKNLLNSVSVRKSTERTTLLIILMTASFFIASLPAGIFTFLQVLYTDVGFLHLSTFVDHYCNVILTINASTHCIECLIMSSEYRRTVKDVLRINKQNVVRISSVVF